MWSMFYGALTLCTLLIAWASGEHVPQKLGLLMLASWASSNVAAAAFGYDGANYVTPALDAIMGVVVATMGIKNRSYAALLVLIILFLQVGVHIVGFLTRDHGTYTLYLVLNLLFLAQLATVGGVSAPFAIRGLDLGHRRFLHHRVGT